MLERLPGGPAAYTALQDLKASRGHDADEMLGRSLDLLALFREDGGPKPPSFCVEVGAGWCQWLPHLLRVSGAAWVLTLDLNPWLSHETIIATPRALLARLGRVSLVVNRRTGEIDAQLSTTGSDFRNRNLDVHPDFAAFTAAELSDDYMWLAARLATPAGEPARTS